MQRFRTRYLDRRTFFFFLFFFLILIHTFSFLLLLFFNWNIIALQFVVLVSAVQQCESAVRIHISPPS